MVQVHIFVQLQLTSAKLLEQVYTSCALADNRLRSRAYTIVATIKHRNGENYDHKHACNDVQVSANAAYGSRFLERTPRFFYNNRCLSYDDCATNMFVWCLQNMMSLQTASTYKTLLEDRSYGDSKHMDFYLMEGTRHLSITGEVSVFQVSRLLTKGWVKSKSLWLHRFRFSSLTISVTFTPRIKSVKKTKRFTTLLLTNG